MVMKKTPLILCFLLATFGIAGPKTSGSGTTPSVTAVCSTAQCLVTGSGYAAGKSYQLESVDDVNGATSYYTFTVASGGTFSHTVTNPAPGLWSFYVLNSSGRVVASTTDL